MSDWRAIGRAAAILGGLGWALLTPRTASANGAFPTASQLKSDPGDPTHLVLGTTFGLLVTRDRGASWDWLCEAGALYRDVEPPLAILPDGSLLLAVPDGVARSDEAGCDFELATGLDGLVMDLTRVAAEPETVVAVSTFGTTAQLFRSVDSGGTFTALGAPVEPLIVQTVDVAPSDPDVIYLSGISGITGALFRSGNRGESFERFEVPHTSTSHVPYIAAVDPNDADTVYVRLTGTPSELAVTRDGGRSFTTVLTTVVGLDGFALSPDGQTLVVSNSFDGTFRARTEHFEFEKVACSGPSCLLFSEDGLLGCGENDLDGYVVGRSSDLGTTFERVLDLSCIRGPLACGSETTVGSFCPDVWPGIQQQLKATQCDPPEVEPYTECLAGAGGDGGDTGAGAMSAGGSTANGGRGGMGNAGRGGTATTGERAGASSSVGAGGDEPSGCGCRVPRGEQTGAALSLGGWLLWLGRRRRGRTAAGS